MAEGKLRSHLRTKLKDAGVWSCSLEYGLGGSSGAPDLLVMAFDYQVLPVELKVGKIEHGRIYPARVRPAQIAWMSEFTGHGGSCRMVIGERKPSGWEAYSLPRCDLATLSLWRWGFDLNRMRCIMAGGKLLAKPADW